MSELIFETKDKAMNILEVKFIKCMKSRVDGASRKCIWFNLSPNRLYVSLAFGNVVTEFIVAFLKFLHAKMFNHEKCAM